MVTFEEHMAIVDSCIADIDRLMAVIKRNIAQMYALTREGNRL